MLQDTIEVRSNGGRRVPPVHACEGARATLNFHTNLHTESQEINLAKAKAAAAATPPMTIVCSALRPGPVPV